MSPLLKLLPNIALLQSLRGEVYLPSSCVGQDDGYQWLKLLDDNSAVRQMCSNDFMVIDVNEDPNVADYFSSYTSWHYALSGPELMDFGNWEEWWLPSAQFLGEGIGGNESAHEYFQFAISPDCSTCDLDNNIENNAYSYFNDDSSGERTAYYMTGYLFFVLGLVYVSSCEGFHDRVMLQPKIHRELKVVDHDSACTVLCVFLVRMITFYVRINKVWLQFDWVY